MYTLFILSVLMSLVEIPADTIINNVQLEEVEVTSSIKENAGVRQQPSSASVVTAQQLDNQHITSVKGISALAPNFYMPDYGSRLTSAVYIRGVGSRLNTPAVGMYVDNIPYVDKSAFDFNFYDIERVDVLRGPQGTLYGRNTMGGLIRVFTKNPFSYEGFDVKMGYSTGDNRRMFSISTYQRISDKTAVSASLYGEGSDGFFKNSFTGKKVDKMKADGGHGRVIYKASQTLSFDFNFGYDRSDEGAYPYFYTGTLSGAEPYADNIGKITNNRESSYRRTIINTGLNIDYHTDRWQLNAITGFQHLNDSMFLDQDLLSADIYTLEQKQRINTLTEEIVLKNKGEGRWKTVSGVNIMYQWLKTTGPVTFYDDGLRWLEGSINSVMPPVSNIFMLQKLGFKDMRVSFPGHNLLMDGTYNTPTLGAALFHQSSYQITDHLTASLGIRFDYEHQQMKYNAPADVKYGFSMPNANSKMSIDLQDLSSHIAYTGKLTDDRFRVLPKLAMKYDFDKDNNIYTSFSMGQRSGGYNLQMFSDLLQGSMRIDMMDGIKKGVGSYMEHLTANNPNMPKTLPDPDNPANMIPMSEYVVKLMSKEMPSLEAPAVSQVVYKPEYSWNYELGTHLTLLDHTLLLDAAVFYSRIYDQQIARFAPTGLGRMMVNAGRSASCGGELSVTWCPVQHLALVANYGYTHATFRKYDDGSDSDYTGKRVPFVPMHTMNVDAAYTFTISKKANDWSIRNITLGCNLSGAGNIYWTEDNSVSESMHPLLNARLSFEAKRFAATLWSRNITDSHYNTFYFQSSGRGFEQHCRPFQMGLDVNLRF